MTPSMEAAFVGQTQSLRTEKQSVCKRHTLVCVHETQRDAFNRLRVTHMQGMLQPTRLRFVWLVLSSFSNVMLNVLHKFATNMKGISHWHATVTKAKLIYEAVICVYTDVFPQLFDNGSIRIHHDQKHIY